MKSRKKTIVWIIVAVLVLAGVIIWLLRGKKPAEYNTVPVEQLTIENIVMATGYIQPVEEVEVGTQVSGVIEKIYVDYNSTVKKGELMAELDKSTLEERLTQAEASVNSAQSQLTYAKQNFDRTKMLHDNNAATTVDLETAQNQLTQAQTSFKTAQANYNQAEVNLSYAYIYSPIDGVVLSRSVNTGQTVAASFNTPTLFTIAEDLTKMQVEADVDEADIGAVKVGQSVTFTVDAFTGVVFNGTVSQIRLQPVVTNNVVTYTVIVEAPNPDEKLYPGMTANITIVTSSQSGLSIPIAAMNFTMEQTPQEGVAPQEAVESVEPGTGTATVWVLEGDKPTRRTIETGLEDGVDIIVTRGLGEEVILSVTDDNANEPRRAAANPLMPQRRRR